MRLLLLAVTGGAIGSGARHLVNAKEAPRGKSDALRYEYDDHRDPV